MSDSEKARAEQKIYAKGYYGLHGKFPEGTSRGMSDEIRRENPYLDLYSAKPTAEAPMSFEGAGTAIMAIAVVAVIWSVGSVIVSVIGSVVGGIGDAAHEFVTGIPAISGVQTAPAPVIDPYKVEVSNKLRIAASPRIEKEQTVLSSQDLRDFASKRISLEYSEQSKNFVKKNKSSPYYKAEMDTIKVINDPSVSQFYSWAFPAQKQVKHQYKVDRVIRTEQAAFMEKRTEKIPSTDIFRVSIDSCVIGSASTPPSCQEKETTSAYLFVDPAGKIHVLKGELNTGFRLLDEVLPPEQTQKAAPAATEKKRPPTNTTLPARPEKSGSEKNSKLGWNGVKPVGIVASLPVTQNRPPRSGSHFNCG